ncbi:unnamed protein product [marine sediment metagenome]|uniref:Uncharacterized protein n=1 Tax=marine sediment metagenome TaxID=412755 RepID=X1GCA2_9ZZZZ
MTNRKGIPVEELTSETRAKLNIGNKIGDTEVSRRLVILGRFLQSMEGLSKRDALWICRTAITHLKGYREKGKRA